MPFREERSSQTKMATGSFNKLFNYLRASPLHRNVLASEGSVFYACGGRTRCRSRRAFGPQLSREHVMSQNGKRRSYKWKEETAGK